MDGPLQGPPTCRLAMPRWWSPTGDEVDDLRFRLHLPNDLADLFLRQLRLGEADAVELASHVQRSLNHRGLVGAKKQRRWRVSCWISGLREACRNWNLVPTGASLLSDKCVRASL